MPNITPDDYVSYSHLITYGVDFIYKLLDDCAIPHCTENDTPLTMYDRLDILKKRYHTSILSRMDLTNLLAAEYTKDIKNGDKP